MKHFKKAFYSRRRKKRWASTLIWSVRSKECLLSCVRNGWLDEVVGYHAQCHIVLNFHAISFFFYSPFNKLLPLSYTSQIKTTFLKNEYAIKGTSILFANKNREMFSCILLNSK